MFDFLKKPVSYELHHYVRHNHLRSIYEERLCIRLIYRFIPYRPRLDSDKSHNFFSQFFGTSWTYFDKCNDVEKTACEEAKNWFENKYIGRKAKRVIYDF